MQTISYLSISPWHFLCQAIYFIELEQLKLSSTIYQ